MKILKITGNICLVFLAIFSVIISICYGYYHYFVHETTTGTNYIDNQSPVDLVEKADSLSDDQLKYYEDRKFFEVNYYSNSKENGIELQELKLNYFTDFSLNLASCRSTGMQYVGDFEEYRVSIDDVNSVGEYVVPDFYYYDTTDMISWNGGKLATQLNRDTKLIIKIGDKPYQIQLTGKHEVYGKFLWWEYLKSATYYDYGSVFYDVMNAIESNSQGYGDYYITLDLSNYFTVYEFNTDTGKWREDNITDEIFTYAVCKFHYYENGATSSDQSLFGIIECDSNFNLKEDINAEYWQERVVFSLSEEDIDNDIFKLRYSDTYDGYFISLNLDVKKIFEDMPRAKVCIELDLNSSYLDEKNISIVGIDYNAFENFEIDTFTLKGRCDNFYILNNAFVDSNLQKFNYSSTINLDVSDSAFNNEYVEGIL